MGQVQHHTRSYVCGTGGSALMHKTVGVALDDAAREWGDRVALISRHQGIRWTYRELAERASETAAGLIALGAVLR